jgi:putative hydrolase of the HAD superfamily
VRPAGAQPVALVIFDAVGTLIEPDPSVSQAYAEAGREFGVDVSAAEVKGRFRGAMERQRAIDAQQAGRTSPHREHQRWQQVVADVFSELADTGPLFERLWGHFAQVEHWRVTDDAARAIRRLNERGLPWGIGSNFDERLLGLHAGLAPLATCPRERVFVSALVGHLKPYAGFFRHVEQAVGLAPGQILLVGDDPQNDFDGACLAGWQGVLLEGGSRLEEIVAGLSS